MKSQVALVLMGFVALSTASGYTNLVRKPPAQLPVPANYAPQQAAPAPTPSYASDEGLVHTPVAPEEPQVNYKAPVRIVNKAPIRVATSPYAAQHEEAPRPPKSRGGYGGAGGSLKHQEEDEVDLDEQYASNAQYSFASAIDDGIQDQSQHREETRDGKKVTGSYSYSDGYFMRTVQYEADENGYRVVGGSVEPIRESGPEVDLLNGRADVLTQIGGVDTQYSVNAEELARARKLQKELLKEEPRKGGY